MTKRKKPTKKSADIKKLVARARKLKAASAKKLKAAKAKVKKAKAAKKKAATRKNPQDLWFRHVGTMKRGGRTVKAYVAWLGAMDKVPPQIHWRTRTEALAHARKYGFKTVDFVGDGAMRKSKIGTRKNPHPMYSRLGPAVRRGSIRRPTRAAMVGRGGLVPVERPLVGIPVGGANQYLRLEGLRSNPAKKGGFYVTTFCNYPHRLSDGKPIKHECYTIPPTLLKAEMAGDDAAWDGPVGRKWRASRRLSRGVKGNPAKPRKNPKLRKNHHLKVGTKVTGPFGAGVVERSLDADNYVVRYKRGPRITAGHSLKPRK